MSFFSRRFTAPGASPGTLVESPDAVQPRIRKLTYTSGAVEETLDPTLDELAGAEGVTWIEVRGLGDGTLVQELGERLGLHPLTISDVINLGQRPKIERYGEDTFTVLRMVALDGEQRLQWEQVSLYLRGNTLVTFQESYNECLAQVRERIRTGGGNLREEGAGYLACMVIDAVVDGFFPVLEAQGEQLELLEDQILECQGGEVLSDLYMVKRDLASFRRSAWPLREAVSQLSRDEGALLSTTAHLHLRDTLDHAMQVVEVNESYRELAASLVDVHLSLTGQRTNEVMRVLTVVSAIFIPLTFVAGVYGMNFDTRERLNLPELRWEYGYLFFWAVCLSMATSLVVLFRRLGWLGSR